MINSPWTRREDHNGNIQPVFHVSVSDNTYAHGLQATKSISMTGESMQQTLLQQGAIGVLLGLGLAGNLSFSSPLYWTHFPCLWHPPPSPLPSIEECNCRQITHRTEISAVSALWCTFIMTSASDPCIPL